MVVAADDLSVCRALRMQLRVAGPMCLYSPARNVCGATTFQLPSRTVRIAPRQKTTRLISEGRYSRLGIVAVDGNKSAQGPTVKTFIVRSWLEFRLARWPAMRGR